MLAMATGVDRAKRITAIEGKIESTADRIIEMMNEMMRMMAMGFEKLDLRKEDQTGEKDRLEAGPITSGSYAMDQVMDRSQQCVRKLTPLVVEQQLERNTETFREPAMVVQERMSRSSNLEWFEKQLIEIAGESGISLEELEETRGMTGYVRLNPPVTKLEDKNENHVFLLDEVIHVVTCENVAEGEESPATMIDLLEKVPSVEQRDKARKKKKRWKIPLVGIENNLGKGLELEGNGDKSVDCEEPWLSFVDSKRSDKHQCERGEQMEAVMNSYACHMLDKMHLRGKKVKMNIKKEFTQSKRCKYQAEKVNSEMAEFQRKNRSRSQRNSLMKCWKRVRCLLMSTHQRCRLLKFIKKKKGRMKVEYGKERIKDVRTLMNTQLASGYPMVKKERTKWRECKFRHKQKKLRKIIEERFLIYLGCKVMHPHELVKLKGEWRPAAIMRRGSKLKCVAHGKLLSGRLVLMDTKEQDKTEMEFGRKRIQYNLSRQIDKRGNLSACLWNSELEHALSRKKLRWCKRSHRKEACLCCVKLPLLQNLVKQNEKLFSIKMETRDKSKQGCVGLVFLKMIYLERNSLNSLLLTRRGFTIQSSWRMKGYKLVKWLGVLGNGNGDGRQRHAMEYVILFSLSPTELKKLLMEWEKHKAGDKYKKKQTAMSKMSFSGNYVVNLVNLMRKEFLTSGKRAKSRQTVMSNGLGCLEMLSPPRMAGKKASSKSLCDFVFLLHILENQIMESASPPCVFEHNDTEAVHRKSKLRCSGQNLCKLKQQEQHKFLLSGKRVKLQRESRKEKFCGKWKKRVELCFEFLPSIDHKENAEKVCHEKMIKPSSLEMSSEYEMIEKQKLETWRKEVSWMEQVMKICLDIWKAVRSSNLEEKVDFKGGGNDTYKGMRWQMHVSTNRSHGDGAELAALQLAADSFYLSCSLLERKVIESLSE